jgi:5-methylcytosine-specific restriction endonuclease McrA
MNANVFPHREEAYLIVADPSKATNSQVHVSLKQLSRSERKITHEVLLHIIEVEKREIYRDYSYDRVYEYLIEEISYDESGAYRRIQAARILKNSSGISEKLIEGTLKLTQLVKLDTFIKHEMKEGKLVTQETRDQILNKLEHKTGKETKQILAEEFNYTPKKRPKETTQKDGSVRVEITFTQEERAIIKTAQDLISHVVYDYDLAQAFVHLAKSEIKKKQGPSSKLNAVKHGASTKKSSQANSKQNSGVVTSKFEEAPRVNEVSESPTQTDSHQLTQSFCLEQKPRRKYIPMKTQREVRAKANHRCEHIHPNHTRCTSTYQTQIDHVIPVAKGGTNTPANLRLLCAGHNRLAAKNEGLAWPR